MSIERHGPFVFPSSLDLPSHYNSEPPTQNPDIIGPASNLAKTALAEAGVELTINPVTAYNLYSQLYFIRTNTAPWPLHNRTAAPTIIITTPDEASAATIGDDTPPGIAAAMGVSAYAYTHRLASQVDHGNGEVTLSRGAQRTQPIAPAIVALVPDFRPDSPEAKVFENLLDNNNELKQEHYARLAEYYALQLTAAMAAVVNSYESPRSDTTRELSLGTTALASLFGLRTMYEAIPKIAEGAHLPYGWFAVTLTFAGMALALDRRHHNKISRLIKPADLNPALVSAVARSGTGGQLVSIKAKKHSD